MSLFIRSTRFVLGAAFITLSSYAYSSNTGLDLDELGNPLPQVKQTASQELSTTTESESWWRRIWGNYGQESKLKRLTPSMLSQQMKDLMKSLPNGEEIKESNSTYFNGIEEPNKFYHFDSETLGTKVVISNPVYIADVKSPIVKCQLGNLSYTEVIEEIMNPEIIHGNNKVILMPIVNQDNYFFNILSRQHYTLLMIVQKDGKSEAVHIDSMDPINKWFACPLENKLPQGCAPLEYKYLSHQGRFNEECGYYVMSYINLILKNKDIATTRTLEVRSNITDKY